MFSNVFRKLIFVGLCATLASLSYAQSWQFVGSRAMGMGGAGVATAYGPDAQYWNPAGLAQEEDLNETGLLLNAGADIQATKDVLEGVRDLTDMSKKYKNLAAAIAGNAEANAENISTIFKGLSDIDKLIGNGAGALVNANAGLGFKMKNFAVSARAIGTGAVTPVVDTKNLKFNTGSGLTLGLPTQTAGYESATARLAQAIDDKGVLSSLNTLLNQSYADSTEMANALINAALDNGATTAQVEQMVKTITGNIGGAAGLINQAASATGSYAQNETLAMADAATFGEVALGYGTRVIRGLKLGANLKVIDGYMAQSGVMILSEDKKVKDILDKAYDNKKSSVNLGVDVGAMVNLSELLDKEILLNPQIGLTAKNLNGPKFDRPDAPSDIAVPVKAHWNTDKYQLKPQVRAGAAINPIKNITVAADIDLTENDTLISGIDSRQLALGMEINLFNRPKFHIPLRVGYNKNIAESDMSDFFTAGIGLNMLHFYIELAGAMSSGSTNVDGHNIPNSAAASLSLGFLF
ncbi:MAG: conjugal transfer protein TraF [Elusimicrobiaceae bacterium]|nr:conjugal transfer protein TraF [Elusimicrobiaceae bacterium]